MKKVISIVLTIIIIFCLSACSQKQQSTDSNFTVSVGGVSADTYILDSWKEELSDGTREYYLSLYLYSKDYYALLDSSSIKFLNENGEYEALTDVFEGSNVNIIDFNDTKQGTSTIAIIKTKQMIDNKKIYVLMEGPVQYDKDILTKEDYINKYNKEPTDSEWVARLCSSSNRTPPIKTISFEHNSNEGIFGFSDNQNHYFYYSSVGKKTVANDKVYTQWNINKITNFSAEQLTSACNASLYGAKLIDNQLEYSECDQNIQIYCELNENIMTIGYKTIDGKSIEPYLSKLPTYLAYDGILSSPVGLIVITN